ncbi:MAG: hypothetical protein OS112_02850 [Methanoregula sp.]|nr:MAG: hypothetical protein OS112_02850 [Methanoregula sp.]
MKPKTCFQFTLIAILVMAVLAVLPVSGLAAQTTTVMTTAAAQATQPYVSATVSAPAITAGQPITISGVSSGPSDEVQIWIFAGNYINVTTVPVNADGKYSKTYATAGFPAATYYVFVQNPGADNKLQITTRGFSGEVVNANTGAVIFNFTGKGSVTDKAAVEALSNALALPGVDDIYTKTQFSITAEGTPSPEATTTMMPGSDRDSHGCIGSAGYTWCEPKQKCLREWEEPCTGASPTTAKSSLPLFVAIAGLALACCIAALYRKQ